ncbi:MAG: FAD-binding oxidoreductase, partial [Candidatus Korobacteraceae bacterium]
MSTATTASHLIPELRAICGAAYVVEPSERVAPSFGNSAVEAFTRSLDKPQPIAVTPGSVEEIAAILRLANEQGFGVLPAGSAEFRPPASAEVVLFTTRLTDVEHYDPADLTVGVGAGTTVAQLNAMVGKDQLLFGADPPFPEHATIGGVLATAGHGPLRHGYGALRDFCLGVRFITGDGRKAKGGGRVVKNVA